MTVLQLLTPSRGAETLAATVGLEQLGRFCESLLGEVTVLRLHGVNSTILGEHGRIR